jgi:hypothetical protein
MTTEKISRTAKRGAIASGLLPAVAVLAACVTPKTMGPAEPDNPAPLSCPPNTVQVNVYFTGACPTGVNPVDVNIDEGNRVCWVSQSSVQKDFSISYSPFAGNTFGSNGQTGIATSNAIRVSDDDEKGIGFKYAIIGEGCNIPLDPRIIVN